MLAWEGSLTGSFTNAACNICSLQATSCSKYVDRKITASRLELLMQARAQQQMGSAATGLHAGCPKIYASLLLLISPDADTFSCCALA